MICGALLVTVPTAMTVIAGKLAAANVLTDIYPAVQRDNTRRVETKTGFIAQFNYCHSQHLAD